MMHFRRLVQRGMSFGNGAVALLLVAGCQDAGTDPTALSLGEDAHPAAVIAAGLPSVPGLARGAGVEIPEVVALWVGSWALEPTDAEMRRVDARAAAAAALAPRLGAEAVADAVTRLAAALALADRFGPAGLPDGLGARVEGARAEAEAARGALAAGRLEVALAAALAGADLLRGVGPEGIARTLMARVEGGLSGVGEPGDPLAVERAERLLSGARQAVERGDHGLAIQRAYSACQLLGITVE